MFSHSQKALSKNYYIVTLSRDHGFLIETAFGISNSRYKIRAYYYFIRDKSKETQKVLINPIQQTQMKEYHVP